ncbi:OmpA family protein [Hymenobacter sp. B81]|uniref:OmpA family protein n=1 Tax=Hymenobacter sp. B81 TaxID=3344878 RepID=UPI0037DCAB31
MRRNLLPVLALVLACLWPSSPVAAQAKAPAAVAGNTKARNLWDKAQQQYAARQFDKAIETLTSLNQKFPSIGEAYLMKGKLHKSMGELQPALEAYRVGLQKVAVEPSRLPDFFELGELALSFGEYETARDAYQKFVKVAPKNQRFLPRVQRQLLNCEFALNAIKNPIGAEPQRLGLPLNTFYFQYFPVLTADNRFLVYTVRKKASEDSDEDIYVSRVGKDGSYGEPALISSAINSQFQEGAATISGDGKTLVFTSCNRPGSLGSCDLYVSRRTGNAWSKPLNLGGRVNSAAWDSQPSLSADGRTLYFTSDRQGGRGQEDIYVTTLEASGQWSPARNLGAPVNTPGKDMAPFIHASGTTLYYVTDGLVGMGGLDVYRCSQQEGKWDKPVNLGYPLNTHENEASLFISSDNRRALCSRSRAAEGVADSRNRPIELFGFDVPAQMRAGETTTYAQGRVFDAVTKKPIKADVQLYDLKTDELTQFVTSDAENGEYTLVLNEGRQYGMYAAADKYLMRSLNFDYSSKQTFDPLTLDIYLEPVRAGRSIVLNNLFFDTREFALKPNSRTELNRLIQFMGQYPDIQVEVSGHTDDVGSDDDNLVLSKNRARSVYTYLVEHGVKAERLRFRGYGEQKPVVPNDSEANRQQNRRIELRIL